MSGSDAFFEAVKARRTYYALDSSSLIPDSKIVDIIQNVIKHVPSSFNSQSARAIILFHDDHRKLWSIVHDTLKAIVPESAFAATAAKIAGFAGAHGTVMWFEDQGDIKTLQEQFPTYAAAFPVFSEHSSGMHQYVAWTALEAEGLGANLQHYSPLIDEAVRKQWGVPESWKLESQLVFGTPTAQPGEKTFKDVEERVKVYGA